MSVRQGDERRAELAANLAAVTGRIADAARAAGRESGEITLVAVTKTFPAVDVITLAGLGQRDVGENRDQEAAPKAAEVAGHPEAKDLRWHFVGQLQRNKCASVVQYADIVHSVDRLRLVSALTSAAERHRDRPLDVLVQVSLAELVPADRAVPGIERGGAPPADVLKLADEIVKSPVLRLQGVMAVAPLGVDPADAFDRLAAVADRLRAAYPQARAISAGMSADLDVAIRYGATHLRIGTALLGGRSAPAG